MKFGVIVFPGSNCDHDCYHIARHVMGQETSYIWHKDASDLSAYDCIIVPGGFSYGDYLRPGAIAKYSPITEEIKKYADEGGLVIGICNGFQILIEAGLLPGVLMRNRSLKFICRDVYLRTENTDTPFTSEYSQGQVVRVPIAHHDGNYFADADTMKELEANKQIVFRYSSSEGVLSDDTNPNGSLSNIAGICNKSRNVLGMMPHPERCAEKILGNEDGIGIFRSIAKHLT